MNKAFQVWLKFHPDLLPVLQALAVPLGIWLRHASYRTGILDVSQTDAAKP
jgi:hypothetical protein